MAKKLKGDQILTGQLLREGDVVFMTAEGAWEHDIQLSCVANTPEELSELETLAQQGIEKTIISEFYPIEVQRGENGQLVPAHIREKIRVEGPTIAYGYDA